MHLVDIDFDSREQSLSSVHSWTAWLTMERYRDYYHCIIYQINIAPAYDMTFFSRPGGGFPLV